MDAKVKKETNGFFAIYPAICAEKLQGRFHFRVISRVSWAMLLLLSGFCFILSSAQAETPYYHLHRKLVQVDCYIYGTPTLIDLYGKSLQLTDTIVGTIDLKTNQTSAIERQAAIPIVYGSPEAAWNAATNYIGTSNTTYPGKIFDNVGWLRGTRSYRGEWGAYLWVIQNRIEFQSSTSRWWTTTNGLPIEITNVMVGTLGDYGPVSNVVDIGPKIPTNFPGASGSEVKRFQVDITNVGYQLFIPDIWIEPRYAYRCVGGSNVQYSVISTNITNGVTWSLIPDLSGSGGATSQPNADWHYREITPGNVATNYKVRATSVDNTNFFDEVDLTVVRVVIENYTGITYDGLESGPLVCRIEPEGITPSSYAWSATWLMPAYNDPHVTFQNPTGQVTRISNTHWYSTNPPPDTGTAAVAYYGIYSTVQIDDTSCLNTTPAIFSVDVYSPGGQCSWPDHTGIITVDFIETNNYFMVASVVDWERIDPVISNAYTTNSQFYLKVQSHEEKHESDFNNGYTGHMFYQKMEFEALVIGLTNSTVEGLTAMVNEARDWFLEEENGELWDVANEIEDRAYQVSDAVPPFYVYQRRGL